MTVITYSVGQSLHNFQAAIQQEGGSMESYLKENYINKWTHDSMYHIMAIRTTFVTAMQQCLVDRGLLNMEKVSLSPLTDPLAHDVEHVPSINYKGHSYHTTHSMIYSKFLACYNPKMKGIFVDSPNIRLEMESPVGDQRKKYVIDFSQLDIEVRRNRNISYDEYINNQDKVQAILTEDLDKALDFFEDMIIHAMTAIADKNDDDLKALGIAIEVPKKPFPRFLKDESVKKYGPSYEKELGKTAGRQFYWVTGLMRENYDLIYPYIKADGSKIPIKDFTSDMIYNYDLCAQSLSRTTHEYGQAYEVLSGAIREWLFKPIVERLLDNKIITEAPEISEGNLINLKELGGYGPFLMAAAQKDAEGKSLFPDTFGGGIGIERTLFALCQGEKVKMIDDVMLFGKNPDSHPVYLF
jgi:aspartyl/asparaginyl-tRNA synthetase